MATTQATAVIPFRAPAERAYTQDAPTGVAGLIPPLMSAQQSAIDLFNAINRDLQGRGIDAEITEFDPSESPRVDLTGNWVIGEAGLLVASNLPATDRVDWSDL